MHSQIIENLCFILIMLVSKTEAPYVVCMYLYKIYVRMMRMYIFNLPETFLGRTLHR